MQNSQSLFLFYMVPKYICGHEKLKMTRVLFLFGNMCILQSNNISHCVCKSVQLKNIYATVKRTSWTLKNCIGETYNDIEGYKNVSKSFRVHFSTLQEKNLNGRHHNREVAV